MYYTIVLGDGCNFNCEYCFEEKKSNKRRANPKYIKLFFDEILGETNPYNLKKHDTHLLEFIGGEPLMYIDLIEQSVEFFLKAYEKGGYKGNYNFILVTNGYLLNTLRVQNFIDKYRNYIQLACSVDGNKLSHDTYRVDRQGHPTYDIVWNNFLNTDVKDKIARWTINANTAKFYSDTMKQWIVEGKEQGYEFDTHFNTYDKDFMTYGYKDYSKEVEELIQWYKNYPDEWVLDHRVYLKRADFKAPFMTSQVPYTVCIGARATLDVDGNISKCICNSSVTRNPSKDFIFGNIITTQGEARKEMWKKASAHWYTNERKHPLDGEDCIRCPIGHYCGRCPVGNYGITGDIHKFNKYICNVYALRHLEKVFFNNYWVKVYKDNVKNPEITRVNNGSIIYGKTLVMNIVLPKCWALEVISEDTYNYLSALTEEVGGNVSPLEHKFYTCEEAEMLTTYLNNKIDSDTSLKFETLYTLFENDAAYDILRR